MDQKQRDKIAWVLALGLGLVLIYILAVNVFKVGAKRPQARPSRMTVASPSQMAPPAPGSQVQSLALETALDSKVLAEQQKIAARLPRRNPFSAAQVDNSLPVTRPGAAVTANIDLKLKVSAIISRPGSNKRIAMINGKMIEEGDRIGEWTILKVNAKNVVLDNGAQQMVVGVK